MRKATGNVISFRETSQKKRKQVGYECFVTTERLKGHCDLLIYETGHRTAEYFCLRFSPEGLVRYERLHDRMQIKQRFDTRDCRQISYLQAIRLLGDAVRQSYKYATNTQWIDDIQSVHLHRIWDETYYNDKEDMDWLLPNQDCADMLQTYFCALGNKDAALLYDMSAATVQAEERRSMYAYNWSHVLEDMHIYDFSVDQLSVNQNGEEDYTLFVTVYGDYAGRQMMEVDLRLRIIRERGDFRILQEQVLEPRMLYKRKYC